jgi:hypothetical protein
MDQELLSPELAVEVAAWWRQAFEALHDSNPDLTSMTQASRRDQGLGARSSTA